MSNQQNLHYLNVPNLPYTRPGSRMRLIAKIVKATNKYHLNKNNFQLKSNQITNFIHGKVPFKKIQVCYSVQKTLSIPFGMQMCAIILHLLHTRKQWPLLASLPSTTLRLHLLLSPFCLLINSANTHFFGAARSPS